tara:strand:+ start:155 stop:730 length:576 start_codon:yes stop_codon:yes gene_type:complete
MVGVLALQGDFEKHKKVLDIIGVPNLFVKNEKDLFNTKALIIPGGESSTLSLLMDKFFLRKSILKYSEQYSVFGTCAGMIMLSSTKSIKNKVKTLNIMDFSVSRNSWGPQVFSFEEKIDLKNFNISSFNSIFIRAPKVSKIGKKIVRYDFFKDEIVILEDGMHLACSFHPEIEGDIRIHQYFLNKYYYGRS